MSFSGEIKEELAREQAPDQVSGQTELYALLHFLGMQKVEDGSLSVRTEQVLLAKKIVLLIREIRGQRAGLQIKTAGTRQRNRQYRISIPEEEEGSLKADVEKAADQWNAKGSFEDINRTRAWLRGAFLSVGSMSDPEKSYHLEWICKREKDAAGLVGMIKTFEIEARITERKGRYVVYLKDSTDIVDMLNIMGAHKSLMEMENVRIMKEMRNSVNRQFNCDTANIRKIVRAAGRQVEDIRYIEQQMGLEKLSPALRQIAEVRLEYPDVSLQELGEYMDPPVGKSGVNHRLRKLSQIAEDLREGKQ